MVEVGEVVREFERYMTNGADRWFERHHSEKLRGPVAYFCAEYGLTEALGIYSGGLGVLAGDHMKTTSDMALPFVGVGLLYRHGYFHQTIDADGHQEHAYPDYDMRSWPIGRVYRFVSLGNRERDLVSYYLDLEARAREGGTEET